LPARSTTKALTIALRSGSILPSMLAHALNNGCLVALAELGFDERTTDLGAAAQAGIFAAAALALAGGVWLVFTLPERKPASDAGSHQL